MSIRLSTRCVGAPFIAAAIAIAIPAAAEERAPELPLQSSGEETTQTETPPVNLVIEGLGSGLHVRVLSKDEADAAQRAPAGYCTQDCELKLPAGSYTLVASRGEQERSREITLTEPTRLTLSEPSTTLRDLGTVLGIAGIVVASVGAVVSVAALTNRSQGDEANTGPRPGGIMIAGFGVAAAGAGMIVGGFSLASANRIPSMEVDAMPPPPRLLRSAAGAGLSLGAKF